MISIILYYFIKINSTLIKEKEKIEILLICNIIISNLIQIKIQKRNKNEINKKIRRSLNRGNRKENH